MVEQPCQVSVAVLKLIELLEFLGAELHFSGESASGSALLRPMSVGQYFSGEFNSINYSVCLLLFEVSHQILGEVNVSKHLRNLVHCVMTTFHLEFLQHLLLSFSGEVGFVEETSGQEFGVSLDEDVSSVKTAEESNNCLQSLLSLLFTHSLQSLLQLIITVTGNIMRSILALIHEVLERLISINGCKLHYLCSSGI